VKSPGLSHLALHGPSSLAAGRLVAVITDTADEPTEAVMARSDPAHVWDAYFRGRAAPMGRDVPPEVVHALFDNFADGEVVRHIPRVRDRVTPEAANAARRRARPPHCAGS
jgi:hypothetical protein